MEMSEEEVEVPDVIENTELRRKIIGDILKDKRFKWIKDFLEEPFYQINDYTLMADKINDYAIEHKLWQEGISLVILEVDLRCIKRQVNSLWVANNFD
jgi:hypothetical protein